MGDEMKLSGDEARAIVRAAHPGGSDHPTGVDYVRATVDYLNRRATHAAEAASTQQEPLSEDVAERLRSAGLNPPSAQQDEREARAFEDWLARVCPSGDCEAVQRQWEESSDYADLHDDQQVQAGTGELVLPGRMTCPGQIFGERRAFADGWNACLDAIRATQKVQAGGEDKREAPSSEDLSALLPGCYYMDPPDGGSVTLLEQLHRMARDAARWRTAIRYIGACYTENGSNVFCVSHALVALAGFSLMKGSVAEHFTKAIDAALSREQPAKPSPLKNYDALTEAGNQAEKKMQELDKYLEDTSRRSSDAPQYKSGCMICGWMYGKHAKCCSEREQPQGDSND